MLRQDNSLSPIKNTAKINSIQTESGQFLKRRSFSLRKITNTKPNLNFGHDFNVKGAHQIGGETSNSNEKSILKNMKKSPTKSKYGAMSAYKLSPIKQYETKLKISAECWLVYDYRKDSYKRGWRPADIQEYSGLTRLLLLKVFIDLQKQNPSLKNFNMRVNTLYLKQQVELRRQEKLPPHKRKGLIYGQTISRVFANNIVVNIIDLLYGLLMTNYDDILEYAIIFIGYLCYCHVNKIDCVPEDRPCHFIEKVSDACANAQYFGEYTSTVTFPSLQMTSSSFQPHSYTFLTTANDICRLYLSIEDSPLFKQILSCKQITCKIKYQIGFRYWQNRTMVFRNCRIDMGSEYLFVGVWKGHRNYGVVCRNLGLGVLVVLQDCKFGMAECDITNIQAWVRQLMNPIVDFRKTHAKLLPILRSANISPSKPTPNQSQTSPQKSPTKTRLPNPDEQKN